VQNLESHFTSYFYNKNDGAGGLPLVSFTGGISSYEEWWE